MKQYSRTDNTKTDLIVEIAKSRFAKIDSQIVHFVKDDETNLFLNDLQNYPHSFVLSCLMDRQIKAEIAWLIPSKIKSILGTFKIEDLAKVKANEYQKIFSEKKLHRFNDIMADVFYCGIQDIYNKYSGNAAKIWENKPSSSTVVYRFLEFKGSGVKIATMAANILARQFRIEFSDYYSIDISPDVHIRRVMKRMGFVPDAASNEMIIYKARELYPEFPGIIDFSCWEIGREWCHPRNPECDKCLVKSECKKII
ncbi:MAG: iron-sulfur cluster loop [Marinilabiliales bacterium]|nr:MAG: iron-sulfur cluster loop [Marinilabiliales bacterium]